MAEVESHRFPFVFDPRGVGVMRTHTLHTCTYIHVCMHTYIDYLCLRSSWSWSEVLALRPRTRLGNFYIMYAHKYERTCTHAHINVYAYTYIYMYVCMYVCVCVYMYVCNMRVFAASNATERHDISILAGRDSDVRRVATLHMWLLPFSQGMAVMYTCTSKI